MPQRNGAKHKPDGAQKPQGESRLQEHHFAPPPPATQVNVGETERVVSAVCGGMLAAFGLSRTSLLGLSLLAAGAALIYRGLSGHCPVYGSLGVSTAEPQRRSGRTA